MWPFSDLCHQCGGGKLDVIDAVVMETRSYPCKGFEVNTKFLLKYMQFCGFINKALVSLCFPEQEHQVLALCHTPPFSRWIASETHNPRETGICLKYIWEQMAYI